MRPKEAAAVLAEARRARTTLVRLTDSVAGLDEDWAYAVQDEDRAARLQRGERVLGAKLGLTSTAKQERMGVDRPIVGFLTDSMVVRADATVERLAEWSQPRIEPEIAFRTSRTIDRGVALDSVADHVATVGLAAEIIDSRWSDYRFRLADVVADNTSAAGVVLGTFVPLTEVEDLTSLRCEVSIDGTVVHQATGAAILGDPLLALHLLAEHLERRRQVLPAGSLVLAGAMTDAVPMAEGHRYDLSVEQLGTVSVDLT